MPMFMLFCTDKPDKVDLRLATRAEHLAYAAEFKDQVRYGGPLLNDKGEMTGSLVILETDDIEAVRAFNRGDPYTRVGLFEQVEIRGFLHTLGKQE